MSTLRKQLRQGEAVVGSWINTGSPVVVELMAGAGFDFLAVDVEHSPVDLPQTFSMFQAMRSGNPACAPLVRLHGVDYAFVKRYLDAGAEGVIAPLVRTAEEAQALVEATKYPPLGNRGVGFCRANGYGHDLEESVRTANDDILVAVQIEHIEAVDNIDAILSVEGIDAVFIGPYDLSASMGLTAQFEHPAVVNALERIRQACHRHGIAPGLHVVPPDPAAFIGRLEEGYQLLAYSLDITFLQTACRSGLSAIRAHQAKAKERTA